MSFLHSDLVQRFIFFLLVILIVVASPLITVIFTEDIWVKITVGVISSLALFFGFRIATFQKVSNNRVRLAVVTFSAAACFIAIQWQPSIFHIMSAAWNAISDNTSLDLAPLEPNMLYTTIATSIALLTIITISAFVLLSLRVTAPMGTPDRSMSDVLPEVTNLDRLKTLKLALSHRLDVIDHETQWSAESYVPLEAEVQIIEGRTTNRRIVDLLSALSLKHEQRMVFLVLGDPGSGKSVALRKLSRDLLKDTAADARIAIYINLKEWKPDREWSPDKPPTPEEFSHFVFHHVMQGVDLNSQSFFKENYKRLHEAGFLFFILDSFDEMPLVLDRGNEGWLIESISTCIVTFLLGGKNARGVISSRFFRKPKIFAENRCVYEIRPFSDDRILRAIHGGANEPDRLAKIVFAERADLGSLARNPFILRLIINHFNTWNQPPSAQSDIFATYFSESTKLARETYHFYDIDDNTIIRTCESIALAMFQNDNKNLEISEEHLRHLVREQELSDIVHFLTRARVARVGASSRNFSFSHRRFHEYFLVLCIKNGRVPLPLNAIQEDSGWRDALVLYAEIAPEKHAKAMLEHAFKFIQDLVVISLWGNKKRFIDGRNALRFVIEGFRNRVDMLGNYQNDLVSLVESKINSDVDYIETRTVIEAIGLLPANKAANFIIKTINQYSGWISEGAVTAARYLPRVGNEIVEVVFKSIVNRPTISAMQQAQKQKGILSIANGMSSIVHWINWWQLDIVKTIALVAFALTIALYDSWFSGVRFIFVVGIDDSTRFLINMLMLFISLCTLMVYLLFDNAIRFFDIKLVGLWVLVFLLGIILYKSDANGFLVFFSLYASVLSIEPRFWSKVLKLFKLLNSFFVNDVWRNALRLAVVMGLIVSLAFFASYLASMLIDTIPQYIRNILLMIIEWIIHASGFVALAWLLFFFGKVVWDLELLRYLKYLLADKRDFTEYRRIAPTPSTRSEIAGQFCGLRTKIFRLRYVDWLEGATRGRSGRLQDPMNAWPDGQRPQMESDPASVKLAQLDARWLGLD